MSTIVAPASSSLTRRIILSLAATGSENIEDIRPDKPRAPKRHKSWDSYFEDLWTMWLNNGNFTLPTNDSERYIKWISRQRAMRERGTLDPEKIRLLDKISFPWRHDYLSELQDFRAAHGTCLVPHSYVTSQGAPLGVWVKNIRKLRPPKLVEKLDDMGFSWDANESKWAAKFDAASTYFKEHGNLDFRGSPGYRTIRSWCNFQRMARREELLDAARIAALDRIGFDWGAHRRNKASSPRRKTKVNSEKYLQLLGEYRDEFGDTNVPYSYVTTSGEPLGSWVSSQRTLDSKKLLRIDTSEKLRSIGLDLSPVFKRRLNWERNFLALLQHRLETGRSNAQQGYVNKDGIKLGLWIMNQRHLKVAGKLHPSKIDRLDSVGFAWAFWQVVSRC